MTFLSDVVDGRDNNLNLIRMAAATGVLISHAYPISLGTGAAEPLHHALGFSLGHLCVLVFFGVSGLLITQSFDRSSSLARWTKARVLRILPGLVVVTVLTAFVLGPLVTQLPLTAYLSDLSTWLYVPRNATLAALQYDLPGVFKDNPYPSAINGSLWTLKYEVTCYAAVAAAGLFGALKSPHCGWLTLGVLLAFFAAVMVRGATGHLGNLASLGWPFMLGAVCYRLRDRIPLSVIGIAALAVVAALLRNTILWDAAFNIFLVYAVFWLAYIPKGWARHYNRFGDYSYGMYVYAFPVQQTLAYALGDTLGPWGNMALAAPITLGFAILSWRFVEKPALALKGQRRPRAQDARAQ